ncbi:MAG: hypothetical protein QMD09_06545 [Desulfatibacillaceae bacterium]|nr:hypothetical protein [Desulfatibacillaceae bacterium]
MSDHLSIHARIEIPASVLQSVVACCKKKYGANQKGNYSIDTAEELNSLISRFLAQKDFASFAADCSNY